MKEIILSQDKVALVDDEDYDYLHQFKWRYNRGYVERRFTENKKQKRKYMHREIMELKYNRKLKSNELVDHKNTITLDNQKNNLRLCNKAQNGMNRDLQKNNTSGYSGVCCNKNNKFIAYIKYNSNRKHIGTYETKEEAAYNYNIAAIKYHGEFANLNDIVEYKIKNENGTLEVVFYASKNIKVVDHKTNRY